MNKKLLLLVPVFAVVFSSQVVASCTGTGAFSRCWDDNGNSYDVRRFGNTTRMDGYNSNTGSTWSQDSRTIGGTTYHNGYDADGNSWSMTQRRLGSTTYIDGTDSDGNSFSKVCNRFGCN